MTFLLLDPFLERDHQISVFWQVGNCFEVPWAYSWVVERDLMGGDCLVGADMGGSAYLRVMDQMAGETD